MSAHFSKFLLNTYAGTPYFQAHVPDGYPWSLVLQKCRAFRRLPPNLRVLSRLAKQWTLRTQEPPPGGPEIDDWYDEEGYELAPGSSRRLTAEEGYKIEPGSGRRLTDEEIDAEWERWAPPDIEVEDIPVPPGGFPDPETWEPPPPVPDEDEYDGPTEEQILRDIADRGREYTARYYALPADRLAGIGSDLDLARAILFRYSQVTGRPAGPDVEDSPT